MISHSKHGILLKVLYAKGGTLTVTCAVQHSVAAMTAWFVTAVHS